MEQHCTMTADAVGIIDEEIQRLEARLSDLRRVRLGLTDMEDRYFKSLDKRASALTYIEKLQTGSAKLAADVSLGEVI